MWLLLASPFVTIIMSFLLMSGLIPKETNKDNSIFTLIASNLFAFFVLLGFSLCSGLFILSPVTDKENKLRHLMNFVGMKPLAYYVGSFLADFILFSIPTAGFIALLFPLNIKYFIINGSWATLLIVMISFGFSLISLTYLFSFVFSSANNAFKQIGIIYLVGGTMLPSFVGGILSGVDTTFTTFKIFRTIFFIDPFWNFSDAMNQTMVKNFLNEQLGDG